MEPAADRADAVKLLSIYLRDHRAGAAAGLRVAQRCRRNHPDGEFGGLFGGLEREIAEDRDRLDEIMERLGISHSTPKELTAVAAERLGRLKLNGRTVSRSPLSLLLELEGLIAGVTTKRNLWYSLAAVLPADRAELDVLIERASDQIGRLEEAHRRAAVAALPV